MRIVLICACLMLCACASEQSRLIPRTTDHAGSGYLQVEGTSEAIGRNGVLLEAVGIRISGDAFSAILPKDCKLPCSRPAIFSTQKVGQTRIGFQIYRGNSPSIGSAHDLGLVQVYGYPQARERSVVVTFVADSSGISVEAKGLHFDQVALPLQR